MTCPALEALGILRKEVVFWFTRKLFRYLLHMSSDLSSTKARHICNMENLHPRLLSYLCSERSGDVRSAVNRGRSESESAAQTLRWEGAVQHPGPWTGAAGRAGWSARSGPECVQRALSAGGTGFKFSQTSFPPRLSSSSSTGWLCTHHSLAVTHIAIMLSVSHVLSSSFTSLAQSLLSWDQRGTADRQMETSPSGDIMS